MKYGIILIVCDEVGHLNITEMIFTFNLYSILPFKIIITLELVPRHHICVL